jgi:hypothetical protein
MPKVDDAFTTYDAQANREDLSDIIYNIDPFDTPIMTAIGRRNISNVVFDWQTEDLPNVDTAADLEGFELARAAATPTVRQTGVAQIKHRDATVSGSQDAANPAGKRKEMAHQMALVSKALKRDCEKIMFGTAQVAATGSAAVARTTRAFVNWIYTNTTFQSGALGADPIPGTNTPVVDDGVPVAFTEDMLNDTLELCYMNGAEPSLLFVNAHNKRVVSTFLGRTSARQMIAANKVVNSVTLYASDFGDLKVLPHRWMRGSDAFLIDPAYARVAYYRKFQRSPIAKIGDADTEMILTEFGLQVDNEAAHGVIRDLVAA